MHKTITYNWYLVHTTSTYLVLSIYRERVQKKILRERYIIARKIYKEAIIYQKFRTNDRRNDNLEYLLQHDQRRFRKYFNQHKSHNYINRIIYKGSIFNKKEEILRGLRRHFQELFNKHIYNQGDLDEVDSVQEEVDNDFRADFLVNQIIRDEVE